MFNINLRGLHRIIYTLDEFSERLDKYVKAHPEIMQPVQLTE